MIGTDVNDSPIESILFAKQKCIQSIGFALCTVPSYSRREIT